MSPTLLTLQQASERLGVHYMTVYRYVRTGRLPATKRDGTWAVDSRDLEALRRRPPSSGVRGRPAHARRVPDLVDRLLAGDEAGAWSLAQAVLGGGASPVEVYLELFAPALREVGERWHAGTITVADEHCASGVMQRLIGRMGPLFARRGRSRGVVVLGAPEGELHSLPTALAADVLRAEGFEVVDLGADVPTESFVGRVSQLPGAVAVGVAVTTPSQLAAVRRLVRALRAGGVTAPIILGGSAIDEPAALALGADGWADTAARLASLLTAPA